MGTIYNTGTLKATPETIISRLNLIRERDRKSRVRQEDMYRGDFGSSHVNRGGPLVSFEYLNTEKQRDRNEQKFNDLMLDKNDKYIIHYASIRRLGFLAAKLKVETHHGYKSVNGIGVKEKGITKRFKNITELKKYVKNLSPLGKKRLHNAYIVDLKTYQNVGVIAGERRVYKSKPKKLPKKYDFITEYNEYIYGGGCPY